MEVAHRQRIDQDAIEKWIRERSVRWYAVAGCVTWRGGKCQRFAVDAQAVVNRELEIAFGVNRSAQMIVEIAAFRHVAKKSFEQWGTVANRLEVARGLLLGILGRSEISKLEK